jgi:hypothetical protein
MSVDNMAAQREIGNAISEVLHKREDSMANRWVVLVETIRADGERGLWTFTNEDASAWDTTGMLTHALNMEAAKVIADHSDGDE